MAELVKGITIPDEAYLDYASGEGPGVVNANQDFALFNEADQDVVIHTMRMAEGIDVFCEQNGTIASVPNPTITKGGLIVSCTLDLSGFAAGVAVLQVRDPQNKPYKASLDVKIDVKA